MTKKQRGVLVLSLFAIASLLISACEQSLSTAPAETPTVIPTGLFVSPIASVENPMAMIEEFAKQTAAAQTATAGGGTPGTPVDVVTGTPGTPSADLPTATPTTGVGTPTNVGSSGLTPASAATSVPAGSRPASYTLQKGEFPYCIARRYNLDPDDLLSLNGLSSADAYNLVSGTVLKIPQSGTFPGSRALAAHPATYTVASADETVYSVACKFGDVEPNAIATANNISVTATLTAGQQLQIP